MEFSEVIEKHMVDNVFLVKGPRQPQKGTLVLVGHHMIFSSSAGNGGSTSDELWLLHRAVDRVLVEPISRDQNGAKIGGYLKLKCKNFMICMFEIANYEDCAAVGRSIETLSNLSGIEHDYPFYYRCPFNVLDDGWSAFDTEQDFARLVIRCPDRWRISAVNKGFSVCPSYPELVIVPKGIGDDFLKISASFRDGSRFPVLSYYHHETKSCIMRCGQPLVGPTGRRCREDFEILRCLLVNNKGYIVDTRSKQQAQNARNKGGGFEVNYVNWNYMNCPVPRVKDLHESLAKLVEICNENNVSADRWMSKLIGSGWLQGITDTITAAATVAQFIHCEGSKHSAEVPVVVHGGEGLDSTLLATSLAQLILDPDARTVRGFEALIEREWISAGHPFSLRCAHSAYATGGVTGPQEGPVFLCFLDCTWQIYQQYPCSFEFTEEFLIFLFEHAYASEFGSFLGNSEKEKRDNGVKKRTVSLWSYVNNPEVLRTYVNALYEPNESVLWPSVSPQSIVLWERLYFRWQRNWSEIDAANTTVMQWKVREKELQSKVALLRRQVQELSKDAHIQAQLQHLQIKS
ncbi:hypothetical protein QR680_001918 [Steinernema hermaphroditum]|uniref:Myotubularin phosphatase domain-containing protein n=1 Tax=Steinernema hermaphroditum TaxID=289476 RepID=A0AA39H2H9_9BILA|nr:hypothetical protein QR680_001918 [Steinernema hermaphroditum]